MIKGMARKPRKSAADDNTEQANQTSISPNK